jgi:hypothetical protein
VLYLSGVPFADLGFPTNLDTKPYPKLTWDILSEIPNVVGIGGVALAGVYWVINRRMMMERLSLEDAANEEVVEELSGPENGGGS